MKILQILRKEKEKEEEEEEKIFCMEKESTNMKIISINCGSVILLNSIFHFSFFLTLLKSNCNIKSPYDQFIHFYN